MTADQILELLRQQHANYAAQDNVVAAKVARALRQVIEQAEQPSVEELRAKFLE